MANSKEIKDRIKGIEQTQKITKAMQLISSVKMGSAKTELDKSMPYFDALKENLQRIFCCNQNIKSRYICDDESQIDNNGKALCLVFSAEKGLAGSYNQSIMEKAVEVYIKRPDTVFLIVGECGKLYFKNKSIPFDESFNYNVKKPTTKLAGEISEFVLNRFNSDIFSEIELIYTAYKNSYVSEVKCVRLLPFKRTNFYGDGNGGAGQSDEKDFLFVPSASDVLENAVCRYITGYIYCAMTDSFCSEQQARMTAMDSANKNADELLKKLSLQYNHVRQNAITSAITEVAVGAKAQKRNFEEE